MKTYKISSSVQDGIGQGKSWQLLLKILGGASLMVVAASVQADSPQDETGWQLEGTWVISVSIPNVPAATHLVYGSYLKGGVVIASPDLLPPTSDIARMDTGQGVWKQTGKSKKFISTFVARAYDVSGQPIKMIKINANFRLTDKDSMEGKGKLLFCDLDLSNCIPDSPGFSNLNGTRLQVEPLQIEP